jgi:hypothetical protein
LPFLVSGFLQVQSQLVALIATFNAGMVSKGTFFLRLAKRMRRESEGRLRELVK